MFAPFMVDAWIAGTLVALVGGAVGFFVVLRGSAFLAHAIPNGSFAGAAAASLLGINVLFGLGVASLGAAVSVGLLGRRGRRDVATALTLVFLLGLGALFLSWGNAYAPAVYGLLFGEILGVSVSQLWPTALLCAVSLLAVALLYRPLLLAAVLGESGAARRGRAGSDLLFGLLVALATTLTVPVVGTTLIFSLLIGPAAGARAFTDRPLRALMLSVILALATVWIAIAAAYASGWPVGFYVGLISAGWYLVGRVWAAATAAR
ncbi:MAG TPA: metal ABC transporter permease [Solirubrobacteraceae bacterium]|nr:metal ABC transporter permease [Solirubrobacteraceae bacterium]